MEKLVNFNGKIALVKESPCNGTVLMMVKDEISGEWEME